MAVFKDKQDLIEKFVGDSRIDCPVEFKPVDIDALVSKACGYDKTHRCSDLDIKKGYENIEDFYSARKDLIEQTRLENIQITRNWLSVVHDLRRLSDCGGLYEGFCSDDFDNLATELTDFWFECHDDND